MEGYIRILPLGMWSLVLATGALLALTRLCTDGLNCATCGIHRSRGDLKVGWVSRLCIVIFFSWVYKFDSLQSF